MRPESRSIGRSLPMVLGLAVPLGVVFISALVFWPTEPQIDEPASSDTMHFSATDMGGESPEPPIVVSSSTGSYDRIVAPSVVFPSTGASGLISEASAPLADASRHGEPEPSGVNLLITKHPVLSGKHVEAALQLSGSPDVSSVECVLAYPGDQAIVGAVRPGKEIPGTKCSSTPAYGRTTIRVEVDCARLTGERTDLVSFRVNISRRVQAGTVIPIRFASARAIGIGGEEIGLTTDNGFLLVVDRLDAPFAPDSIDIPEEESIPGERADVASTPGPDDLTSEPTPQVTQEPTPTPAPRRFLTVSDGVSPPGRDIDLEVLVDDSSDLMGAQFRVSYDPQLVRLKKVRAGPVFDGFFAFVNSRELPATVAIAGAHPVPRSGGAVLCLLRFSVLPTAPNGSSCSVSLSGIVLAGDSGRIEAESRGGLFSIPGSVSPAAPLDAATPQPPGEAFSEDEAQSQQEPAEDGLDEADSQPGLENHTPLDNPAPGESQGVTPAVDPFAVPGGHAPAEIPPPPPTASPTVTASATATQTATPTSTPVSKALEKGRDEEEGANSNPKTKTDFDLNFDGQTDERDLLILLDFCQRQPHRKR